MLSQGCSPEKPEAKHMEYMVFTLLSGACWFKDVYIQNKSSWQFSVSGVALMRLLDESVFFYFYYYY